MSEHIIETETSAGVAFVPIGGTANLREEIVRCRDCENAQVLHPLNPITGVPAGIEYWRCAHFWNADELCDVEPDGFCAWGERRDA